MADDFSRLPFSASGGDLQLTGQVLPPCGRIWCLPFFLQMLLPLGGNASLHLVGICGAHALLSGTNCWRYGGERKERILVLGLRSGVCVVSRGEMSNKYGEKQDNVR